MNHYYEYCYAYLMMGTSYKEILQPKETYECLESTHGTRVCAYRVDNGIFLKPLLKEVVQKCGQQISYYGVVSKYQNAIFELTVN